MDSTQTGYLTATQDDNAQDAAIDDVLQKVVVSITGLQPDMVRPRWQAVIPTQPAHDVDWCAIGITALEQDANHAMTRSDNSDVLQRHEVIKVLATFYGTNAMRHAAALRDGMCVEQNRDFLRTHHMNLFHFGTIRAVPELINQKWIKRYDLEMNLRRQILKTYPVLGYAEVGDVLVVRP